MSSSVVAFLSSIREKGTASAAMSLRISLSYSTSSSWGEMEKMRVILTCCSSCSKRALLSFSV